MTKESPCCAARWWGFCPSDGRQSIGLAPGYLLGVPQMLHPEPKKKGFHAFLTGVDDCRMMTNPRVVSGQHFFFGGPCSTIFLGQSLQTENGRVPSAMLCPVVTWCHLADIPWIRQGWWSNRWSRDWSPSPVMGPGPWILGSGPLKLHPLPPWAWVKRCALVGKGATTRRAYGKTMRKARFFTFRLPLYGDLEWSWVESDDQILFEHSGFGEQVWLGMTVWYMTWPGANIFKVCTHSK